MGSHAAFHRSPTHSHLDITIIVNGIEPSSIRGNLLKAIWDRYTDGLLQVTFLIPWGTLCHHCFDDWTLKLALCLFVLHFVSKQAHQYFWVTALNGPVPHCLLNLSFWCQPCLKWRTTQGAWLLMQATDWCRCYSAAASDYGQEQNTDYTLVWRNVCWSCRSKSKLS